MPPASPVPGWSSGDVGTLIMATRRTASASVNPTATSSTDPHLGSNPVHPRPGARDSRSRGSVSESGPRVGATVSKPEADHEPADGAEGQVEPARGGGGLVE